MSKLLSLMADFSTRSCPVCGNEMRLIKQRTRQDQKVVETWRCKNNRCRKYQTCYQGTNIAVTIGQGRSRKVTEAQVARILESNESNTRLAKELGFCTHTILKIRKGRIHADIRPDLERKPDFVAKPRLCHQCIHWSRDKCTMDFPESKQVGYANVCSVFEKEPRTNSASTISSCYSV